ncbi:hypothetical protein SDC9_91903 [bioreactor metagenome]|uniref:Uncharacterized protein n=1 Tax=bioreactor metagenome TaxID=1076179 RepID=A0A644ZWT7_9ZZZZ
MGDSHGASRVVRAYRQHVLQLRTFERHVTHVADRAVRALAGQALLVYSVVEKSHPAQRGYMSILGPGDARGFLPAVLKRVKAQVDLFEDGLIGGAVSAKNSAHGVLCGYSLPDFLVCSENVAEVLAEAVLVEVVACGAVPEAAGVRRYLVGEDEAALHVLAEFKLEIDQHDALLREVILKDRVDAQRDILVLVELFLRGPAEEQRVVLDDEGISERVVLVAHLKKRAGKDLALFDAEALAERAGGDVAHDDLKRHDLDAFDDLVRFVYLFDEMRLHAVIGEDFEEF